MNVSGDSWRVLHKSFILALYRLSGHAPQTIAHFRRLEQKNFLARRYAGYHSPLFPGRNAAGHGCEAEFLAADAADGLASGAETSWSWKSQLSSDKVQRRVESAFCELQARIRGLSRVCTRSCMKTSELLRKLPFARALISWV